MKLENQVCSLELAKKLKELGVKQESLFYYYDKPIFINDEGKQCGDLDMKLGVLAFGNRIIENDYEIIAFDAGEADMSNAFVDKGKWYGRTFKGGRYSAFTVAELGEMLKNGIKGKVFINGSEKLRQTVMKMSTMEDEAEARAKILIYLIENKLISKS